MKAEDVKLMLEGEGGGALSVDLIHFHLTSQGARVLI